MELVKGGELFDVIVSNKTIMGEGPVLLGPVQNANIRPFRVI